MRRGERLRRPRGAQHERREAGNQQIWRISEFLVCLCSNPGVFVQQDNDVLRGRRAIAKAAEIELHSVENTVHEYGSDQQEKERNRAACE